MLPWHPYAALMGAVKTPDLYRCAVSGAGVTDIAPPSRCPSFLHALREEIGDKAFFAAFKNVLDDHRFKHITTLAVIDAVNRASGKDYTEWFYRYVAGTEWPEQRKKTK